MNDAKDDDCKETRKAFLDEAENHRQILLVAREALLRAQSWRDRDTECGERGRSMDAEEDAEENERIRNRTWYRWSFRCNGSIITGEYIMARIHPGKQLEFTIRELGGADQKTPQPLSAKLVALSSDETVFTVKGVLAADGLSFIGEVAYVGLGAAQLTVEDPDGDGDPKASAAIECANANTLEIMFGAESAAPVVTPPAPTPTPAPPKA